MSRIVAFLVCLFLTGLLPAARAATDQAATAQVRARLLAAVDAVSPGEEILVGLEQRIIPDWHTYWRNPGDSGLATAIAWELPAGATASDIEWPTPSRFLLGPVANFGYSDRVVLLSRITVPPTAQVGGRFPLRARVDWLVCKVECLPQQVDLALSLPVVATHGPGQHHPSLLAARALVPAASPWPARWNREGDTLRLRVAAPVLQQGHVTDVAFFPHQWGRLMHAADQPRRAESADLVLDLKAGEAPPPPSQALDGVLVVTEQVGDQILRRGYQLTAAGAALAGPEAGTGSGDEAPGLLGALGLALLGGVVLNLMPCVFPVLSIKALSLVQHAHAGRRAQLLQGLAYTAGILASFALLALLLIGLQAGGAQVGWGFQFQSPLFVLLTAYLMFLVGLALSGVFVIGGSAANLGAGLAARGGFAGSFFTGVLATLVATPCTAPFMGAAIGFALGQPAPVLMAVFLALGQGLALPYLLLCLWPGLQRRLPRPGAWMERLKEVLAFPMYGAAVWLVWVLAQQSGANGVLLALGGMVVLAFAAWLYGQSRHASTAWRLGGSLGALAAVVAVGVTGSVGIEAEAGPAPAAQTAKTATEDWEAYRPDTLQRLRAEGKPVFLNFTAAWCISCLVNEKVALSNPAVKATFRQAGIATLKGDWTNQDPAISARLAEFGRSGVPLYVFYPPGSGAPRVLPQLLTPEIVIAAVSPAPPKLPSHP